MALTRRPTIAALAGDGTGIGLEDGSMTGRKLVWIGTLWIIVAGLFLDWVYVAGKPASWGERTPLWLYAIGFSLLVAAAIASTRRSPSRRVLLVAALPASGVIAYSWAALVSKPPEILGMPEAGYVTFGALVLLAGLATITRAPGARVARGQPTEAIEREDRSNDTIARALALR
jgi:peptidoglycan/LPS O-acetylase OafA/YrhL